jgi:serine/threonine protein kinase
MPELKLQQSRLDGRYDILECLGRGSYAEIYVAHDNAAPPGAPETVVIKALNISLWETVDAEMEHTLVANFQNEAVALDRVRHPNIISRLGHGTAIDLGNTTFHYLVLEYLPGGDMLALTRGNPLPIQQAVLYLEQVCSGLAHAHKCGVIHRDIKPQNLLLTADRKIVKIADFGVARFEATEGAITRVGTNIYSAPEHNPLVQTGALDTGALSISTQLTPAADVYSLAKTTYSLFAGESPRRFAQHPITELPAAFRDHYWAGPVLRVLEKATQTRPENRYQTVEEFWDDFADATLRPTEPLVPGHEESRRRPSEELEVDPDEFTQAPPQARFSPGPAQPIPAHPEGGSGRYPATTAADRGPRIVVQVDQKVPPPAPRQSAKDIIAAFPERRSNGRLATHPPPEPSSKKRSLLVAVALVLAFSGMLLATHKYVTSRWNPIGDIPRVGDMFVVGREGTTTTDVNLRPDASSANTPIGLAENGSRVKILTVNNSWYEVQVTQHGRPKTDPYSSDRGWINKKFVKFD